ncbi:MAG: hypothetical protein ACJ715_10720 [Ornithinibacter sp.]
MSTTAPTELTAEQPTPVRRRHLLTTTEGCIALASVLAGAIHLAVAPEHLEEWWLYGAFFVVTGLFQLAYAAPVLRRPTPLVVLTGILVNLAIVLIWVVSRTTGLPITPPEDGAGHEEGHVAGPIPLEGAHPVEPGHGVEAVGAVDLVATGAELLVICLLVTLLPAPVRRVAVNLMLVAGVGLWALRLSGVLG